MIILARQITFIFIGMFLRLPTLGTLWLLGKFHLIKIIFQVYPADEIETQDFCPNNPRLRKFFSGRPTLGGFITDGIRPIGSYVVIPNTAQELAQRKNSQLSHEIISRLFRLSQITGAQSIGLAGQLGYIFEKRHNIPITIPLHSSLYGAIFSLSETIFSAIKIHELSLEDLEIGILGIGEIGNALQAYLEEKGISVTPIAIKYTKSGKIKLKNEKDVIAVLPKFQLLVNITPTGDYFLQTSCQDYISPHCIIIDFARPGISANVSNTIYMGNRVHRKGLHFLLSLPGDWSHDDIPACSLASILATMTETTWSNIEEFSKIAKEYGFVVPLKNRHYKI